MDIKELEKKKLELEIRQLGRKWVYRWEFWKVLIPSTAVILSLYVTYYSGFFDTERSRLLLDKAELKKEIAEFEKQKSLINEEIIYADSTKTELENRLLLHRNQEQELLLKLNKLGKKIKLTEEEKALINENYEKKKELYLTWLKEKYNENQSRLKTTNQQLSRIRNQEKELSKLKAMNEFYRSHSKLTEREQEELDLKLYNLELELSKKATGVYQAEIDRLNLEIEKTKIKIDNLTNEELDAQRELIFLEYEWNQNK